MEVAQTGDWTAALNHHVPQRRGYHRNKQMPRNNREDNHSEEGTTDGAQGSESTSNTTNK